MGLEWKLRRLMAMSSKEVIWRVVQRGLQKRERTKYANKVAVWDASYDGVVVADADWSMLGINWKNEAFSAQLEIELLGNLSYRECNRKWLAGFQTDADWPLVFSYDISPGAADAPGDIRTNWELNRHHQVACFAKNLYATGDLVYLSEIQDILDDWSKVNPFLWGPAWASAMEVAIRSINWMFAAAFLDAAKSKLPDLERDRVGALSERISTGAVNMIAYVSQHISRYSSANNHCIVEAVALGVAGYVYGEERWGADAFAMLNRELFLQTHPDGVNKEQSLHYQTFVMEAYGLYLHVRQASGFPVPPSWEDLLSKCCKYVYDCKVGGQRYLEFGDNDEGIILNLSSVKPCHPEHALVLLGMELSNELMDWMPIRIEDETSCWLYDKIENRELNCGDASRDYQNPCRVYPDGGVSILRSSDDRLVAGVDHGPLGFGSIAAHGHADALSVQMYFDGSPIVIDSGTYRYNGDQAVRNYFRSTAAHSTVQVEGKDQSKMLGAFLWGERAEARIEEVGECFVCASHNGYSPAIHQRSVVMGDYAVCIKDCLKGLGSKSARHRLLVISEEVPHVTKDGVVLYVAGNDISVCCNLGEPTVTAATWSPRYGIVESCFALTWDFEGDQSFETSVSCKTREDMHVSN